MPKGKRHLGLGRGRWSPCGFHSIPTKLDACPVCRALKLEAIMDGPPAPLRKKVDAPVRPGIKNVGPLSAAEARHIRGT